MSTPNESNQNDTPPADSKAVCCCGWLAELEAAREHMLTAERIMSDLGDYQFEGRLSDVYGDLCDLIGAKQRHSANDTI